MQIGGEGFETRVVDGILHIKAHSAMLGYLNAPSPFTEDGWFDTGDSVLVDGEYLRFLGRESEIINVGGEKVYPAEVESVIQEMDNVLDAVVYGERNPLMGSVVAAKVTLAQDDSVQEFKQRLRLFCRGKLEQFKIPVKVEVTLEHQVSARFKKMRRASING